MLLILERLQYWLQLPSNLSEDWLNWLVLHFTLAVELSKEIPQVALLTFITIIINRTVLTCQSPLRRFSAIVSSKVNFFEIVNTCGLSGQPRDDLQLHISLN